MASDDSPVGHNLLSYYGVPLAQYYGDGVLTLKDGKAASCRFEAGQLTSGDVLLLCDFLAPPPPPLSISAERFEGTTSDGFRIRADKGIDGVNYLPDTPNDRSWGVWAAFRLREMDVRMNEGDGEATAQFGLTNFRFTGTEPGQAPNVSGQVLPVSLKSASGTAELSIVRVEQYERIMKRLQTLKGIEVTSEVAGDIPGDGGMQRLRQVVNDVCYLLSVARGTKVEWIYCDQYSRSGELIMRTHCSRITKPYCPLATIDPRAEWSAETKVFVEQAYPVYLKRRESYKLNRGLIDAYLDARSEADYIQGRGIKLAVGLETLRELFLETGHPGVGRYIIQKARFHKLIASIQDALHEVLKTSDVCRAQRDAICAEGKLAALNRRSFRHILNKLCKHIGIKPSPRDLSLFIQARNSLVHTGRFYSTTATPDQRAEDPPVPSPADEFFFLVNFLDRIFLPLLGYDGPYVDWSGPKRPTRKKCVSC